MTSTLISREFITHLPYPLSLNLFDWHRWLNPQALLSTLTYMISHSCPLKLTSQTWHLRLDLFDILFLTWHLCFNSHTLPLPTHNLWNWLSTIDLTIFWLVGTHSIKCRESWGCRSGTMQLRPQKRRRLSGSLLQTSSPGRTFASCFMLHAT